MMRSARSASLVYLHATHETMQDDRGVELQGHTMTIAFMHADRRAEAFDHATLISSAKVQCSNVYRLNGERIGRIEHLMIDRVSGRIAYVVMSAGGHMGRGCDYYPMPWSLFVFNDRLGGYELDVSEEHLREAPKFTLFEQWDWSDLKRGRRIHDYWRALPYWGF